jgi:hypothetical protein
VFEASEAVAARLDWSGNRLFSSRAPSDAHRDRSGARNLHAADPVRSWRGFGIASF